MAGPHPFSKQHFFIRVAFHETDQVGDRDVVLEEQPAEGVDAGFRISLGESGFEFLAKHPVFCVGKHLAVIKIIACLNGPVNSWDLQ